MSEIGEVIIEKDSSNDGGNFDAFANTNPHEESTILHTKKFRIGSGNIIGKVTQFGILLSHRDKASNLTHEQTKSK
jgi:hypothetical protein